MDTAPSAVGGEKAEGPPGPDGIDVPEWSFNTTT